MPTASPSPSRPTLPPRHLQHAASSHHGALFPGRGAARLRALASSDALPRERAMADATVLTAWLTAAQRARYAPALRAGEDLDTFVERLAEERRVVLEEGAEPVADEVTAAASAERRARQPLLRVLEGLALAAMVLAVVRVVLLALAAEAGVVPEQPRLALLWTGGAAAALLVAAVLGSAATRRRDRVLLDWASGRPGQLARGVPVARPLQRLSAGPAILAVLGPVLLLGAGLLAAVTGAGLLLFQLLSRDAPALVEAAIVLLVAGTAGFLLALALTALRTRRLGLIVRRAQAVEWLGPLGGASAQITPSDGDGGTPAP